MGAGEEVGKSQLVKRSNVICFTFNQDYQSGHIIPGLEIAPILYRLAKNQIQSLNGILVSIFSAPGGPPIHPSGSSHPQKD